MVVNFRELDCKLKAYLNNLAQDDPDFWSFRRNSSRDFVHNYFQYPAMMVPQMQGVLISAVQHIQPQLSHAIDPFVGSGTTMTEAMMRGMEFRGIDVNPLAVLLCRVKSQIFDYDLLRQQQESILFRINSDQNATIDVNFKNLTYWFREDVACALSCIRRAILAENDINVRRFFWVVLAETVRLCSNARTSNYKLYIRTQEEIRTRRIDPVATFSKIADGNLKKLKHYTEFLRENNLLNNMSYNKAVNIDLGDVREIHQNVQDDTTRYDLLVTSPPYGDSKTTVTYGQHSYLPLQWIQLSDIDPTVNDDYLKSTMEIDTRSLGGSLAGALEKSEYLLDMSASFRSVLEQLKNDKADKSKRVAAFCFDLDQALNPILSLLTL